MSIKNIQLPAGLSMRLAHDSDRGFIENLFNSTRDDLRFIDAETDFIETLIEQQYRAQSCGYGETHPNALYFIIEMHSEKIGRFIVDFGSDYIDIIDIAFIRAARGKGYVTAVVQSMQMAALKLHAPLYVTVLLNNPALRQTYHSLGFTTQQMTDSIEQLIWLPAPLA